MRDLNTLEGWKEGVKECARRMWERENKSAASEQQIMEWYSARCNAMLKQNPIKTVQIPIVYKKAR